MTALRRLAIVRLGGLLSLLLLVQGCTLPPIESGATVDASNLPGTVSELIKYADEIFIKSMATPDSAAAEMENALMALDKAVKLDPKSYEQAWKAARACAWLADDLYDDTAKRAHFSARGMDYGKAAVKANAKGVEGHYYAGLNSGLQATTRTIGAKFMVPAIRDAWKKAMELDATFDHGGPPRALGSLYAQAPPWPASIGDSELGVKLLQQALAIAPDFPQNALLLGEGLIADDRYKEAKEQFRKVLDAQPRPDDAHFLPRWKKKATTGMEKADKKLRKSES